MRKPASSWALPGLTAAVLAAHILLLIRLPAALQIGADHAAAPVFATRSLPAPVQGSGMRASPAPTAPSLPAVAQNAPAPQPAAPSDVNAAAGDAAAQHTSAQTVSGLEMDQSPVSAPLPQAQASGAHGAPPTAAQAPDLHPPAPPPQAQGASHAASSATAAPAAPAASATPAGALLSALVPPAAKLSYSVTGRARQLPYSAQAELLWQHDGVHYLARLTLRAFLIGARSQTSEGELSPQGLEPRRFADQARSEQAAHFHRDSARISFSANTPDAPLQPGAQDRLSLFLQLGALLAAQPEQFPAGANLTLQIVGVRQAQPWLIHVDGFESMALPNGVTRVVKLSRAPQGDYDTRIELWLAPALHYLPVRIRLTQSNGDVADQQLTQLEPLAASTMPPKN